MTMRCLGLGTFVIGALTINGCAHTSAPERARLQLTLAPTQVAACIGDSLAFQATVDSQAMPPSGLTWFSSNSAVASVDQYGNLTAATAGTTWVTVRETGQASLADSTLVTVIAAPAITVSFSSIVRSGTTQPVPLDSLTGAVDVYIATPSFGMMCLNQRYDRAQLMIGADSASLSVAAETNGGVLQSGSMNTLTFDTKAANADGQPAYPDGFYVMWVKFVHHGAFGSDLTSSMANITIRN